MFLDKLTYTHRFHLFSSMMWWPLGILTELGYTVPEAKNGEDALHVCSRFHGKIDLLLTGVVMPKMSGPELAAKLQELFPQTKVMFMSGYTENAIVHHGVLEDGVNFIA